METKHGIEKSEAIRKMSNKRYVINKKKDEKFESNKEIQIVDLDEKENEPRYPTDSSDQTWLKKFKYQCMICNSVFFGFDIKSHMNSLHGRGKSEFKAMSQDIYNCKICHKDQRFLDLKLHLYRKHRLTLEAYGQAHEVGLDHVVKRMKSSQGKLKTGQVVSEAGDQVCTKRRKVVTQNQLQTESVSLENELKTYRNSEEFKCRLCDRLFYKPSYLKDHVMNWHKRDLSNCDTDVVKESISSDYDGRQKPDSDKDSIKKSVVSGDDGTTEPVTSDIDETKKPVISLLPTRYVYGCPFSPCEFKLPREEMRKNGALKAVQHIKVLHLEESSKCDKIKWIKMKVA